MSNSDLKVSNSVRQRIAPKIYWHEGMLLSQHLFQQNDLHNFQVLSRKMSLISRYNWGIITIDIDKNALSNNLFRLNEIEAVFQDGLLLQYSANIQQGIKPLELKLDEITDNEITIYIAIATLSGQISPLSGHTPRFYVVDCLQVADENLIDNKTTIPGLIPNAFLCHEIPEGCIGFPIAKLLYETGNFSELEFTPPCFYISKNSFMWRVCTELTSSLKEKVNIYNENVFNSESTLSFNSRVALTLLMETIISLETNLFNENVKPYDLFKELIKLLYYASTIDINRTDVSPTVPQYKHDNINSCILPIINLVNKYISLINKKYMSLRFNRREHFFYRYISQQNIDYAENKKFYIGIKGANSNNTSDITNWIKNAVIASDFALDSVRSKRILGAVRREVSTDIISKIMPESDVALFEIEIHSNYIKAEQNLHIFNPSNNLVFKPKGIILYLPYLDNNTK